MNSTNMTRGFGDLGPSPFRHRRKKISATPPQCTPLSIPAQSNMNVPGTDPLTSTQKFAANASHQPLMGGKKVNALDNITSSAQAMVLSGRQIDPTVPQRRRPNVDLGPSPFRHRNNQKLTASSELTKPSDSKHHLAEPHSRLKSVNHSFDNSPNHSRQLFLHTGLGKIPPEIRVVIWEYALIAPAPPGIVVNPDYRSGASSLADEASNTPQSSNDPTCSAFVRRLQPASRLALTQVCTQTYQEAQHIFYSINSFHYTSVSSLLGFLKCIGPRLCEELRVLHIDGLSFPKSLYSGEELDELCREHNFNDDRRERLAAETYLCPHPDVTPVAELLRVGNKIEKIFLNTHTGEELQSIFFLLDMHDHSVVDFVDAFHWVVRSVKPEEVEKWWAAGEISKRARPLDTSWGADSWGNRRRIEVDFLKDVSVGV